MRMKITNQDQIKGITYNKNKEEGRKKNKIIKGDSNLLKYSKMCNRRKNSINKGIIKVNKGLQPMT